MDFDFNLNTLFRKALPKLIELSAIVATFLMFCPTVQRNADKAKMLYVRVEKFCTVFMSCLQIYRICYGRAK